MVPSSDGSSPQSQDFILEIVTAIAAAREEGNQEVPPLGYSLDLIALERFVESTTAPASVQLEIHGCFVEIDADGNVLATMNSE